MLRWINIGSFSRLQALILLTLASGEALANIPSDPCTKTTSTLSVTTSSTKTCKRPSYVATSSSTMATGIIGAQEGTLTAITSSSVAASVHKSVASEIGTESQGEDPVWTDSSRSTGVVEVEDSTASSSSWEEAQQPSSTSYYSSAQNEDSSTSMHAYEYTETSSSSEPSYEATPRVESLPSLPTESPEAYTSDTSSSASNYPYHNEEVGSEAYANAEATSMQEPPASSSIASAFTSATDPDSATSAQPNSFPYSPTSDLTQTSRPAAIANPPTITDAPAPPPTSALTTGSYTQSSSASGLSAVGSTEGNGTANCTAPGGGCVVFLTYIAECTTDACACNLTYPAQICAQCIASDQAVEEYNSFLYACKAKGFVQPTQTIEVGCKVTSAVGAGDATEGEESQLQGIFAIPSNETGTQAIQTGGDASSESDGKTVGANLTHEQDAALGSLGGSGNGSDNLIAAGQVVENGSTISGYLTDMTGGLIAATGSGSSPTGTTSASGALSTVALNSTHTFFQTAVEPECEYECADWLDLAQSCTDDTCICTTEALGFASACSACIGQKGGLDKTGRMSSYSEFASSCRSIPNAASSSTSVSRLGPDGALAALGIASGSSPTAPLSAATNSRSGIMSGSANPFVTDSTSKRKSTVTAEEANGIATVTLGTGGAARRIGSPIGAGLVGLTIAAVLTVMA
ncbi:hypothetical protein IAU59_001263 [Kwoniella sp. CBS 9459]